MASGQTGKHGEGAVRAVGRVCREDPENVIHHCQHMVENPVQVQIVSRSFAQSGLVQVLTEYSLYVGSSFNIHWYNVDIRYLF